MKKPNNYYCHRIYECQQNSADLPDVQIIDKIGQGSFGAVYKAFDRKTSKLMVIKKKKDEVDIGFTQQNQVLKEMSSSEGFDRIRLDINNNSGNQIFMECLGPSLGDIFHKVKKTNVYSMKRIACQLIYRLKELHSHLFVHRDLKPDNILLGNQNDPHSVYLIDFGLAVSYKRKSAKAVKIYDGLIGTAKFCSIAAHNGFEQFPKDDLQSIGYILSYIVSGSLPWDNVKKCTQKQLFQQIKIIKQKSSIQELCNGLKCLRQYYQYIKTLNVGDRINYKQLHKIFEVSNDGREFCFDFCEIVRGKCCINLQQQKKRNNIEQQQGKPNMIRCSILS